MFKWVKRLFDETSDGFSATDFSRTKDHLTSLGLNWRYYPPTLGEFVTLSVEGNGGRGEVAFQFDSRSRFVTMWVHQ